MTIDYVFAGVPVADLGRAVAWYERLLGRPPDMLPRPEEAVWRLAATASIYVVADQARAGRALLTLIVDALDAHLAQLAARGIDTGPIETTGAGRRFAVTDPDGNSIVFAQLAT